MSSTIVDDMSMLNLNDLALFVQVVDHGGFAAAARALGLPKSTLSKRVAALEAALGLRLIQRSPRSFLPTEAGRDLHRHGTAMLVEAEAAEASARGRLAEPAGRVRLTASMPAAQTLLAPLLPGLAAAWPRIRLEVHVTDRFVDLLQEGFDLALRSHAAPLPDSGLVQRRLAADPVWLWAAPAYLARHGSPAEPAALAAHDGLVVSPAATWRLRPVAGGPEQAVQPRPRFCADEAQVLLQAAAAGLGIAALPRRMAAEAQAAGRVQRVLPGWQAGEIETTLLMPHRRGLLPAVRLVADHLAAHLAMRDRQMGEAAAIG